MWFQHYKCQQTQHPETVLMLWDRLKFLFVEWQPSGSVQECSYVKFGDINGEHSFVSLSATPRGYRNPTVTIFVELHLLPYS